MKQKDCTDNRIRNENSIGANAPKEKRDLDKEKFKAGEYLEVLNRHFDLES